MTLDIIAPVVRGDVCGCDALRRDVSKDQLSCILAKAAPNVLRIGDIKFFNKVVPNIALLAVLISSKPHTI